MDGLRKDLLVKLRNQCQALATIFLELPTLETVEALRACADMEAPEDTSLGQLALFAQEHAGVSSEETLNEIARERARFVRGAGVGDIKPPYESIYLGAQQGNIMGSVNRFIREAGFEKLSEIRDTTDQIGVEFAFVAALLNRQLAQIEAGDLEAAEESGRLVQSFLSQHLSRWAEVYAQTVLDAAQTAYWRSIGLLIIETMGELNAL